MDSAFLSTLRVGLKYHFLEDTFAHWVISSAQLSYQLMTLSNFIFILFYPWENEFIYVRWVNMYIFLDNGSFLHSILQFTWWKLSLISLPWLNENTKVWLTVSWENIWKPRLHDLHLFIYHCACFLFLWARANYLRLRIHQIDSHCVHFLGERIYPGRDLAGRILFACPFTGS